MVALEYSDVTCNHTILSCQDTLPSGELKKVQKASLTLQASLDALFPPMFLTVDVCKAKWKSLRDAFVKTRKKSIPSGSAGGSQKAWKYSDIMSFILPYIQQRSSTSSLGNPSPLEEIERASTPGAASGYSGPRTPTPTPPTAPPPLVPTTSAERRPSRSRSPQGSTPAAASQRSTKRRPQSTDLGEQLISLLQEPPATPHMPDSPLEESYNFALSLVPMLQRLDIDRKHRAKIAILNTFHSLERESTQPQEHWQPIVHPPTSQHSTHTSRSVALRPTAPQPPQAQSTGPLANMLFSNSGSAWQDGSQYEDL
ncbi:hypothetical protein KUCAC02_009386 [Chaenocephalus aceratus]|uniref:Uncharacterized protein n=1 Tax=Chaenocephalus aceratus TaxID=36190 RepID=A0ACB9WU16_CHAAC|nr:hypothetical protein KUCAC02_009386 [Chaenocephalus aceratus]